MEKKLAWVRKAMKSYVAKVKAHKDSLEEEWVVIQERLEKGFLLYHPDSFQTVKAIHEFEVYISEWLHAMEGEVTESEVEVVLPYSLESQIYSSGNINIKVPGVITRNCMLEEKSTSRVWSEADTYSVQRKYGSPKPE